MIPIPRHHVYKKKKSYTPWIVSLLIIAAGIALHTQEKKIRLFLAGDLRQKIENQRMKIYESFLQKEPTEVFIRDYEIYTRNWLDLETFQAEAHFFRAESYYFDLLLGGLQLDPESLQETLLYPLEKSYLVSEKSQESNQKLYSTALRADALDPKFSYSHQNQFLLFLGESLRGLLSHEAIGKKYANLNLKELEPIQAQHARWLFLYHSIRSGNAKRFEEILKEISFEEDPKLRWDISERMLSFWKGVCYYYAKDYVQALPQLRSSKTNPPDTMTNLATLTEARIFYVQNLPRKAVDLLLSSLGTSSQQKNLFLSQLREWSNERKELNITIPEINE